MMNLLAFPSLIGCHLTAWRHPKSYSNTVGNLEAVIELAQIAERGLLDGLFIADGNAVRAMDKRELFTHNFSANMTGSFEPVTLFSAVSQHTKNIGMVATATTTYEEPYLVARKFASLDTISGGRCGWNVVTSSNAGDALNFSYSEHPDREDRYGRAREFTDVVTGLWDSWAEDAFPQDKREGRYLDPDRVRTLNHSGKRFNVKGPLCAPRSKQGRPVLFSAGQSDAGKELAAAQSEGMFATASSKEVAIRDYNDVKGRMQKYGRRPDSLRFLTYLVPYIGETMSEAEELFEELQSMVDPIVGRQHLERAMRLDLSGYDVDDPMPDASNPIVDGYANREQINDVARKERLTIRQTYERMVPAAGSTFIKGTPSQVADFMEDWFRSGACDGFIFSGPIEPLGMIQLADQVVPLLQKRGLFRTRYEGTTLRANMGLEIPPWDYRV